MANQIATFFRSQDRETAPEKIAEHLVKFWDPRMRAAILAHVEAGGEGLDPEARAAVETLRAAPPAAERAPGRRDVRQRAINCALMRGGTSKGLYFLAGDLPGDEKSRDKVLLAAMGSPDIRQIDGVGGAHPLTSKVAVVGPSQRPDADVEYLFLQVVVDEPRVDASQTCGNILAGVGPFAIERGLVPPSPGGSTPVRIHMVNSDSIVVATIATPDGSVRYDGDARIDGVPGTAAPGADRVHGYRRLDVRRIAADRQRPRPDHRPRRDLHRQRHAGGRRLGGEPRHRRRREPESAGGERGLARTGRGAAAGRRSAHESRRRAQQDRAEDVDRLAAAQRRRDLDADLHPAPGA